MQGETERRFQTAGVVGLGLIGGSMALTLKRRTSLTVCGFDRDPLTLDKALKSGAIDRADSGLEACDIVFVALYPQAAVEYLLARLGQMRPGTLAVDFCGVKRYVCRALSPACRASGVHYIGAHPMAGRELSGFDSALPTLFEGASLILTPEPQTDPQALAALEALMRRAGFGQIVRTTPEHHDRMIAYTSQLAHILSSAYIQSPLAQDYSGFTGGSFQDLTRVARLSADMWGELFLRNRDELTAQLDILIGNLESYRQALAQGDSASLWALMERGTAMKNELLSHTASGEKLKSE